MNNRPAAKKSLLDVVAWLRLGKVVWLAPTGVVLVLVLVRFAGLLVESDEPCADARV